jgi:hypothetical protein
VSYENQTTVATVFAPRRARLADVRTILPRRCDGTSLLGDLLAGLPVDLF